MTTQLDKYRQFYSSLDHLLHITLMNTEFTKEIADDYRWLFLNGKIYDIKADALNEIEGLIFYDNNNADRLINSIHIDCMKLENSFNTIKLKVPFAEQWYSANVEGRKRMLIKMPTDKRFILGGFSYIYDCFMKFYQAFKEKSGIIKAKDFAPSSSGWGKDANIESIMATIDDFLEQFATTAFKKGDYDEIKACFFDFFTNRTVTIEKPFVVKAGNKTGVAYACGSIGKELRGQLNYEYLDFLRKCFSVFSEEKIDKKNINKSNLYKYCTAKT
ncbi:MAG: hypothetical protein JST70_13685 [Bacteroidetes bacterium]|nr:hypothetical protein [Bacteroidota bacterium]